jgi:hypothetical protein
MRLMAENDKTAPMQLPPPSVPAPVPEDEAEDAPDSSRPGVITSMSAAARVFRDAVSPDETPAEGTATARKTSNPPPVKPKKRKRPGWIHLIAAVFAAGPAWTEVRGYIEVVWGQDEAVAEAGDLGEIRGELKSITGPEGRLAAVEKRAAMTDARQHDSDWRGVEEYRVLSEDIGLLLSAQNIPDDKRAKLGQELADQHDDIRDEHRNRLRMAREAKLLEQGEAAAARDTVAPP